MLEKRQGNKGNIVVTVRETKSFIKVSLKSILQELKKENQKWVLWYHLSDEPMGEVEFMNLWERSGFCFEYSEFQNKKFFII